MNDFDEHTWTAEQRALDGRIALEFEGLEGSRSVYEATGEPIEAWIASARDTARALRAQVARLTHAGRRAHWDAELTRLGLPRPPEVMPKEQADEVTRAVAEGASETRGPASRPTGGSRSRG